MALAGVERTSTSSAASSGIRSSAWRLTIRCMVHPSSKSSGLAHYPGGGRPSTSHRTDPPPELLLRDELPDEKAEQHEPPRPRTATTRPPKAAKPPAQPTLVRTQPRAATSPTPTTTSQESPAQTGPYRQPAMTNEGSVLTRRYRGQCSAVVDIEGAIGIDADSSCGST